MLICNFCEKECKNHNSLRNHERLCKKNPLKETTWLENNGHVCGGWNKGLSKETDPRVALHGNKIREGIASGRLTRPGGAIQSEAGLLSLSNAAKKNKLGGHTSKQQIRFLKKDGITVYLQSSYEIRFAQLLEELDIVWSRPEPLIWTDSSGEFHRYYPDFEINGIYVDTKNDFLIKKDKSKIEAVISQNKVKIFVVGKENINKKYIVETILPV